MYRVEQYALYRAGTTYFDRTNYNLQLTRQSEFKKDPPFIFHAPLRFISNFFSCDSIAEKETWTAFPGHRYNCRPLACTKSKLRAFNEY